MHHSRLCAVLIDCKTDDLDKAADFWAKALNRPVDMKHPGTDAKYRVLKIPPGGDLSVDVQKVDHESRAHLDIETDNIPAEVARLEKLGARVFKEMPRWTVMEAPTGQRFCVVRAYSPDFPKTANRWD